MITYVLLNNHIHHQYIFVNLISLKYHKIFILSSLKILEMSFVNNCKKTILFLYNIITNIFNLIWEIDNFIGIIFYCKWYYSNHFIVEFSNRFEQFTNLIRKFIYGFLSSLYLTVQKLLFPLVILNYIRSVFHNVSYIITYNSQVLYL